MEPAADQPSSTATLLAAWLLRDAQEHPDVCLARLAEAAGPAVSWEAWGRECLALAESGPAYGVPQAEDQALNRALLELVLAIARRTRAHDLYAQASRLLIQMTSHGTPEKKSSLRAAWELALEAEDFSYLVWLAAQMQLEFGEGALELAPLWQAWRSRAQRRGDRLASAESALCLALHRRAARQVAYAIPLLAEAAAGFSELGDDRGQARAVAAWLSCVGEEDDPAEAHRLADVLARLMARTDDPDVHRWLLGGW
ncbi:MAG: hypothetical protein VKP62_07135 [Candidatus Sericytochromatia bacterium]|nr:hypothetical protein [Candidatus Sericytochromatia bacterium]